MIPLPFADNAVVKWAAKERSGFADPSSTTCYTKSFFNMNRTIFSEYQGFFGNH